MGLGVEVGHGRGHVPCPRAMYKQLRRAVKTAGALSLLWQATNGILHGCPLSVILVNVLTTMWKWESDSLPR